MGRGYLLAAGGFGDALRETEFWIVANGHCSPLLAPFCGPPTRGPEACNSPQYPKAEVRNVSIAALSDEEWRRLHAAFLEHGFLVIRDQHGLTAADQAAFGRRFGRLEFADQRMSNTRNDGSFVTSAELESCRSG